MDFGSIGVAAVLGLAGMGSAAGLGIAGMGTIGAWKKCYLRNKPAPFILFVFAAAPLTQTIYGFITMNAIAVSLPDGAVVDPYDGRRDVSRRVIRAVGDPRTRFAEDGLRPLRAIRFSALAGFTIDPETLSAIHPYLPVTAKVASERVRD